MQLYFLKDPIGNFGDDLNGWLWPKLIPEHLFVGDNTIFVGIGTILDRRIPVDPYKIVFGPGAGYAPLPLIDDRWKIYFVRGPRTAAALGLERRLGITDPAILVTRFARDARENCAHIAFIPHHGTVLRARAQRLALNDICDSIGFRLIDPTSSIDDVIAGISSARLVIAEAMHGAIVADAFRVPWVPVQVYGHTLDFKWHDWAESLDLTYAPAIADLNSQASPAIALARFLREQSETGTRFLSADKNLEAARRRIDDALDRLKEDLGAGVPGRVRQRQHVANHASANDTPSVGHSTMAREDYRKWWESVQLASQEIGSTIGAAEAFVLVDDGAFGAELRTRYSPMPLVERDGVDWGPPVDGVAAVEELRRQRERGARYVVFFCTSFWWLSHYAELHAYLDEQATMVTATDNVVIYRLSNGLAG